MNFALHKLTVAHWSRNYAPYMVPEPSLPCSQKPTTRPYIEPNE